MYILYYIFLGKNEEKKGRGENAKYMRLIRLEFNLKRLNCEN